MKMRAFAIAMVFAAPIACGGSTSDDEGGDGGTQAATGDDDGGTTVVDPSADDGDDGAETTGAPIDPNAPTFYGDVLPAVIEHCGGCHAPGEIGPFDLHDYATAKGLAEAMAVVTDTRVMPPYNVLNDGTCNTFKDARWLDDATIELFSQWALTGAQEGDPSTPQPEPPVPVALVGADITEHETPAGYLPTDDGSGDNGQDDYQCFLAPLDVGDTARFITGFEVTAGNPEVAHHLVGFLVDLEADSAIFGTNGDLIAQLDEGSADQPGWDCYGSAGNGVIVDGIPITWAPGGGAFNLPEGTGVRVDPGYGLVIQMHYNLLNAEGDTEDSTRVRIAWSDAVEREAVNTGNDEFLAAGFNGGLEIPPGEEAFTWQWDMPVRDLDERIDTWATESGGIEILGILPHMHQIGRRMQIEILPADAAEEAVCGVYVHRWDFDWQEMFMYETPPIVGPDDRIQVTCEWDSTSRDAPTQPGLGSQNEMCAFAVYVAPLP